MYILVKESAGHRRLEVLFSVFPDGDIHCVIPAAQEVAGKAVLIIARLYPDQNVQIMRLVLLLDLLKNLGTTQRSVFCPYLPYSRQDKQHLDGEAVSADTICALLASMDCSALYTLDCHFMKGREQETRRGLSICNISLGAELVRVARTTFTNKPFEVVGPDKGSSYLVQQLGARYMHKQRGEYTRLTGHSQRPVTQVTDNHITLSSKAVLILDDVVSTGSTLMQSIAKLRRRGVEHVYCAVTHGLFLGDSYNALSELADGLLCSDSIAQGRAIPLVQAVLDREVLPRWLDS